MDEQELMEWQLTDLDVAKVDLVGRPANRRKFAVAKEDGGGSMAEELNVMEEVQPEAEAPPDVEPIVAEEVTTVEKSELEAVVKRLESVEKERAELRKELALEKLSREPICKDVGIEPDMVYRLQKAEPEAAKFWIGKVEELHKQLSAAMTEIGTTNQAEQPHDLVAKAEAWAAEHKVSMADAYIAVSKTDKALAAKYVDERQDAVARGGR